MHTKRMFYQVAAYYFRFYNADKEKKIMVKWNKENQYRMYRKRECTGNFAEICEL